MKKLALLFTFTIVGAIFALQAQVTKPTAVDFDYQEKVIFSKATFDLNMNGTIDNDEWVLGNGRSYFYIDHKHYDSIGNHTKIVIRLIDETKEYRFIGMVENSCLLYEKENNGNETYACFNRLDVPQFCVCKDFASGETTVWIINPAILRIPK